MSADSQNRPAGLQLRLYNARAALFRKGIRMEGSVPGASKMRQPLYFIKTDTYFIPIVECGQA